MQIAGPGDAIALRRGQAALAPAVVAEYAVHGRGLGYRVSVPLG